MLELMMLELVAVQASLFEPTGASAFEGAAGWASRTLLGPLAVALCIIAVALVGIAALSGRLSIRFGARVILGSFVLVGAPVIASTLMSQASEPAGLGLPRVDLEVQKLPRKKLPPVDYDPYSGASVIIN